MAQFSMLDQIKYQNDRGPTSGNKICPFAPDHGAIGDLDDGGKEAVAPGPAAGLECLGFHA